MVNIFKCMDCGGGTQNIYLKNCPHCGSDQLVDAEPDEEPNPNDECGDRD